MRCRGQTIVETIIWLPWVLLFIYGALQACQIGVALVTVNYATSSVARDAVRTGRMNQGRFDDLMVVGMKSRPLRDCSNMASPSGTTNSSVGDAMYAGSARLDSFPVVGVLVDNLAPNFKDNKQDAMCPETREMRRVSPVGFTGGPDYQFIVRGLASVRKNYNSR